MPKTNELMSGSADGDSSVETVSSPPVARENDRGSVSHWLEKYRDGDSAAAQKLWDRYFERLVRMAHRRLEGITHRVSGEDIALSAIKSVMIGIREKRFPDLSDRASLWPLLVTITGRKVASAQRRQLAAKRTTKIEEPIVDRDIVACVGDLPSPDFAAEVADELERLVRTLDDPTLQTIALRTLEGYTQSEIADELKLSVRTVIRKINRVRSEWRNETDRADPDAD